MPLLSLRSRKHSALPRLEHLESRLLLTGAFAGGQIDTTWIFTGMPSEGSIQFDAAGNVTAATLSNAGGSTTHPTGTYTLGADGSFEVATTDFDRLGAINTTRDLAALSETANPFGLSLLVNPSTTANLATITGTWTIVYNGDAGDNSGYGSITFDGQGNVTGGSGKDSGGNSTITGGTYTVDASGNVNVTLNVHQSNGQNGSQTLVGAINAGNDVISLNPPDLAGAATGGNTRSFVFIKHTGSYAKPDVVGTYNIAGDDTTGSATVDAAGKVNGTITIGAQGQFTLSGTATVTPAGLFTLNTVATQGNIHNSFIASGAMNTSHNFIAVNKISNGGDNMTFLTRSANHNPTLSTVNPFGNAIANQPFDIPFATLFNHTNAADVDGDTLSLHIESIPNGTVQINGNPVNAFPATCGQGDDVVWTPGLADKGKVPAFTICATDGNGESPSDITVFINTLPPAVITVLPTMPLASELNNGTTKGVGAFTFTRTGGDTTKGLDVDYAIDTSAPNSATNGVDYNLLSGVVHFGVGQKTAVVQVIPIADILTEGKEVVTVDISANPLYVVGIKNAATVTIADYELSPDSLVGATLSGKVLSGTAPFAASGNFNITFGNDNTQYLMFGVGHVVSSSGTFTYSRTTSTTGTVTLTDSVLGAVTGTLTFSSTSKATFDFAGGGGAQHGTASYFISKTFAPASIDGRTFAAKVSAGILPSESTGNFSWTFSVGSALYAITGIPSHIRSHGSFSYLQFSPDSAVIVTNDSVTVSTYAILFSSATNAGYFMSTDANGAQAGSLTLAKAPVGNFTPVSLRGVTIQGVAAIGQAPFKLAGKYTLVFDGGADTYTGTNGFANASSTGTDTYTVFSGTTALLDFTDTIAGQGFAIITFTSAHKATYYIVDFNGDTAKGTWTLP